MTTTFLLLAAVVGGWIVQSIFSYRQSNGFRRDTAAMRQLGTMTVGTGGRRYRGGRAYVALAVDSGGRVRGAQVLRGWTTFAKAKPLTAVVGQRINKVAGDSPIAGLDRTAREACREAATLFLSARQEWREGGVTTT